MDEVNELRNLLKISPEQMEKAEADRVENILRRLDKKFAMNVKKYNRAIQDRLAANSLLRKTSDDLVQRYRTIFEHSGSPMVVIENDGTIILANTFFCSMTGQSAEAIEHKANICTYLEQDACDSLIRQGEEIGEATGSAASATFSIHLPDGRIRDVMVTTGSFPGSMQRNVTFVDVTEQNQLERELVDSGTYLSILMDTIQAGVFVIDAGSHIISDANPAALAMIGVSSRDEVIGKYCYQFGCVDSEGHCPVMDLGMRVDNAERILTTCHGQEIPIIKYVVPVTLKGRPHLLETFIDNSERRKAEAAIELANRKLNLMNNITRHDILNTITGIYGCLDMLRAGGVDAEKEPLLKDIRELVRVIQQQITFTKEYQDVGIRMPQWQNVRTIIENVLRTFEKPPFGFSVEIANLEIYADPLFQKVIYNLVDNAARYADNATQITFTSNKSGKILILVCEDDGVGVPLDQKERIFERGIGRNTGLGLFLTREILEITGIAIRETGVPGKGARFEISIPVGGYRERDSA